MEQAEDDLNTLDRAIGERIKARRGTRGLTLEVLADKSGVSRAMLSRIERGESNPTAQLLGRVCAGLDVTLSALFAETEQAVSPLARRSQQAVWRDPASGYVRRVVTPPNCGAAAEIVDVEFPGGASVTMESSRTPAMDQQIVLVSGRMELTVGNTTHRLEA
ncbi:MAG: helix-turn-helix transcriptional regulator, partial [Pseudolabrys sp.]|nr:helix-turn-helix transcriptional regulator [Pseudolabrys sp.]